MNKNSRLSDKQKAILEDYFVRHLHGETMEDIARSNGIARKTLSVWKNSSEGLRLHGEFRKKLSADSLPSFYASLDEGVKKGEFKKMELYAKVHGLLSPEKQEITTKNEPRDVVKDGYTADDIAELEKLLEEPKIKRVK